jgi:superfamily II DNA or RNA helicase
MSVTPPREGMLATVRNRRALITSVAVTPAIRGEASHVVRVEYMDTSAPPDDELLWDLELGAEVVEPRRLPKIDLDSPMQAQDFDAVTRSTRWMALSPYVGTHGLPEGSTPLASPLFGSIQVEDYQLVPLVRALKMPRVSMALFDDVGLGKSVEAGLVLSELILRRRLRRVLVICPAWLRHQWQEELRSKFSLTFDIVDRPETHALRRRLGMDVNPWRTFPRAIASYHYLKQPDVLQDFLAVCQNQPQGSATLPWDLLIVDEAHNCMPSAAGEDSALSKMLTRIARFFEHKLFLSATPHNGYTQCFTGLLEQLDPVRFTKKESLTASERRRAEEIVVRRLKKDINEVDEKAGRTPRFVERDIVPQHLYFSTSETALSRAFETFRTALKMTFAGAKKSEQMAGAFAVEVLAKRLLSCPYAFADSWTRFKGGLLEDEPASDSEVRAAEQSAKEELDDDAETESRLAFASRVTGAWLRSVQDRLAKQIKSIDDALEGLGLVRDARAEHLPDPAEDARFDKLLSFLKERLLEGKTWRDDERLIVFTEYKTTLNYLARRLRAAFPKEPEDRFRLLYGGMGDSEREEIKRAFNDPDDPVRILLATDAASEGANLQETARLLLHYDIPWNPSRLDQRNGRLDRHGQARDVLVFHFASETDADLRFLGKVLKKVDQVRTDLGAVNELFDAAFRRRMIELQPEENIFRDLELAIDKVAEPKKKKSKEDVPRTPVSSGDDERLALEWLVKELDLSPDNLRQVLEVALGMKSGGFQFGGPDERGRFAFPPIPDRWKGLIDEEVRLRSRGKELGALPRVLFDGKEQIVLKAGRALFRPSKDTVLMHLGHPLVRHALLHLSRARFPGTDEARSASRWIARTGPVPPGVDALVLVTVEELAVNDLRETFHHWTRTLRFPVVAGRLRTPLDHVPAVDLGTTATASEELVHRARDLWFDVTEDIQEGLAAASSQLTIEVRDRLRHQHDEETNAQRLLFKERQDEIGKQLRRDIKELEKEIKSLSEVHQGDMFSDTNEFAEFDKAMKDLEVERQRRNAHHEDMKSFLAAEEQRVLNELLPRRFALRGEVQVFPVTVEIRFPSGGRS